MNTLFIAAIVLAYTPILAAQVQDGWGNLRAVTRERAYTVISRDGHCEHRPIAKVSDQAVTLRGITVKDLVIARADVLRISDSSLAPSHDAVFSGRSSWLDVKEALPRATEYIHIVTRLGEERKWTHPMISDDSVMFEGKSLLKIDIRYVSYVRFKPLTRNEEYVHHENVDLLAPRLWFNGLMLGKISVLLYNSAVPEDNSPVVCH